MLLFVAPSVNVFAAIFIVTTPAAVGVNVAVYVVPLPAKLLSDPFVTVISPTAKLVVDALDVNVKVNVELFVVLPLVTAVLPLAAVIQLLVMYYNKYN